MHPVVAVITVAIAKRFAVFAKHWPFVASSTVVELPSKHCFVSISTLE